MTTATPSDTVRYKPFVGLLLGSVVGAVLGIIGAVVFAWITTTTGWFIGLLGVLPLAATGYGMALGVRERGGIISGLLATVIGLILLGLGYGLIEDWLGPFYTYSFDHLDVITALIGAYVAFKLGTGIEVEAE